MNRLMSTGSMAGALAWWEGRTVREQRMLAVMGLLVLAVLAWLLVVRPAWSWRAEAENDRAVAEARLEAMRRAVARLGGEPATTGPGVDLQAAVAEANGAPGLSPVLGMSAEGGLGFTLTNVPTTAAFGWLAALHDREVEAVDLSVVENTDATVSVEGTLAPAA